jgi:membrane protein DedA with SNARE-associated domain
VYDVLAWFTGLPPALIYLVLGVGAAVENVIPPVPADTFVLAGGLLAAQGAAHPWAVFVTTWLANTGSAIGIYAIGRRYGGQFFKMPMARWLLREHQLETIRAFYLRWGMAAIFFSRFLPAWRSMAPVFAGVSRMRARSVIPPLLLASGLWYGTLVYLGVLAGRNLDRIVLLFGDVSRVLLVLGLVVLVLVSTWWWRSRQRPRGP